MRGSIPKRVPPTRKAMDDEGLPSVLKGKVEEPCNRVPGAAWSLSQVVSIATTHIIQLCVVPGTSTFVQETKR